MQELDTQTGDHILVVHAGTSSAPLVINTPGWVKGLGLSILQDLIAQLQPTHVFAIDGASAHKNLPSGRFWAGGSASDPAPTSVRTSLPCIMQQEGAPAAPLEARPQSLRAATSTAPAALDATAGPEQVHRSASSARSTRFHAWVCSVLQARLPIPLTEADVMLRLQAGQLADSMAQLYGCAPVEVDLQRVPLVSLFEELEDTERAAALNGSLVCLSSISPPGSPGALQIEVRALLARLGVFDCCRSQSEGCRLRVASTLWCMSGPGAGCVHMWASQCVGARPVCFADFDKGRYAPAGHSCAGPLRGRCSGRWGGGIRAHRAQRC